MTVSGARCASTACPTAVLPTRSPPPPGSSPRFIAWQQNPGAAGPAEIRLRYAPDGGRPRARAGRVLARARRHQRRPRARWPPGTCPATPRSPGCRAAAPPPRSSPRSCSSRRAASCPPRAFSYATTARARPGLVGAAELWGAPQYVVTVDGAAVAQTTATAFAPPARRGQRPPRLPGDRGQPGRAWPPPPGRRRCSSTPCRRGSRSSSRGRGHRQHASTCRRPTATRRRRACRSSAASGVATVTVNWGDGPPSADPAHDATHVYTRRRTYTVSVTATDRAGNGPSSRTRSRSSATPAQAPPKQHKHTKKRRRRR